MYKCTNETCNKIIDMLLVPLKVIVISYHGGLQKTDSDPVVLCGSHFQYFQYFFTGKSELLEPVGIFI